MESEYGDCGVAMIISLISYNGDWNSETSRTDTPACIAAHDRFTEDALVKLQDLVD